MSDETNPRILYVGNLDPSVTEDLILTLFAPFGEGKSCKIIREPGSDMYAFIEFGTHTEAQMALLTMNKRIVLNREMKVNWASSPGGAVKQDTSKHFHIFIGDLSPEIETTQLKEAFAPFGEISDVKIIRDPQTHKSKGYGFVCYVHKEEAEMAIVSMNGQWLGGRTIRTNWAAGKGSTATTPKDKSSHKLDYDQVFNQSSANNHTIYCGGIQSGLTEELMRDTFEPFGNIVDVRVFKDKGYAFVKMDSKEGACNGICTVHQSEVNGYTVKCSWGKESSDLPSGGGLNNAPGTPGQYPPGFAGPYPYTGYWGGYPPYGYAPYMGMGGPGGWGGYGGGYGDYGNYQMGQGGQQGGQGQDMSAYNMQGGPNMGGGGGQNMQQPNMGGGGGPNMPPPPMGGGQNMYGGGGDGYQNGQNQQNQQWNMNGQ